MKPKVAVLEAEGTNCQRETKQVFNRVGGEADIIHVNALKKGYDSVREKPVSLHDYHILAIPGGFSYGDYISAGKVFSHKLQQFKDNIQKFKYQGKPIIGICNGFQVLTKLGFLPGNKNLEQTASLIENDSGNYECRWVNLTSPQNKCIWTRGIDNIQLPVAHAEGKFITSYSQQLFTQGNVVFQYSDNSKKPTMEFPQNPNGSIDSIAGICDDTGQILGLMPHPERYNSSHNHPCSSLQEILSREYTNLSDPDIDEIFKKYETPKEGGGLQIFRNGVEYVKRNLDNTINKK